MKTRQFAGYGKFPFDTGKWSCLSARQSSGCRCRGAALSKGSSVVVSRLEVVMAVWP